MTPLRIGLLSFAHMHAETWASCLQRRADVELIGLADEDTARGRYFATSLGLHHFASSAELLAEKPDGVVICTENARRIEPVAQAAAAGAHIFCEKPLAINMAEARTALALCKRADVSLMTAFPMRFSPPVIAARDALRSGQIGQLYGCNTTNQGQLPVHHRAWFAQRALAGGGAMMDHIVHLADLLRWFLGCEACEVYAASNNILHSEHNLDVETGGLVLLGFENGCFASIDCSWSRPANYPTWGNVKLELVGERGLLQVDAFRQAHVLYRANASGAQLAYWGSDANQGLIDEFIAALSSGRAPVISGVDGLRATEIVAAACRSVESGGIVTLPLAE